MSILKLDTIRQEIIRFKNDPITQQLETRYKSKSMPEIMGFSRKELAHSNFIAWLFSRDDQGELAKYNLLKFIEILAIFSLPQQKQLHSFIFDNVVSDNLEIQDFEVETEVPIKKAGRLDIWIKFSYLKNDKIKKANIVIENKVSSNETGDQTDRYYSHFVEEYPKQSNMFVFLTPLSAIELKELLQPQCLNKSFIQINYQALVDYLLEPMLRKSISQHVENSVQDYLLALSQPNISGEDKVKEIVMAISEQERELLTNFWKNHQKLLFAALEAVATDPEIPEYERKQIRESVDQISKSARDTGKISILLDGKEEYSHFKKADIGLNLIKTLEKNNMLDDETFLFLKSNKTASFDLLKTKEEVTDNEAKYKRYRITQDPEIKYNGVEYYVVRNWGRGNSETFKDIVESKFPRVSIMFYD